MAKVVAAAGLPWSNAELYGVVSFLAKPLTPAVVVMSFIVALL